VPYPPRFEAAGHYYHVVANAVDGGRLYRSDDDRELFLTLLRRELTRSAWTCLTYSLLTTHFHVLLRLASCTLSSGMQHLNATYARLYNRKYGRRGALFQRRFTHVLIESDPQLLETVRYVARNAPRANLCELPEEHAWCSYGAAIGLVPPDPIVDELQLLRLFSPRLPEAREQLREFVEQPDPRQRRSLIRLRAVSEQGRSATGA
jgi:hypothetical protein